MNSKYSDLLYTLIKAYYNDTFDKTLDNLITCHEKSPQETFEIITSLCGVTVPFDNNYKYNLKKAITRYTANKKIVEKLKSKCSDDCLTDENGKFQCQICCPFDAIFYDNNEKITKINDSLCESCGKCIDACKDGKYLDKVEILPIIDLLKNNKTVIACVAPAIIGQFGPTVTLDMLREAFIKIGFTDMIEVAFAADILTIKEAFEFNKHVNDPKHDLMITSCCCPIWVGMLKKVYHDLVKDLSPSVSPMIAAARIIKNINKDAKIVFIGPCIAKKAEAKEKDLIGDVDFVLTFEELNTIFKSLDIHPETLNGIPSKDYVSRGGRLYARTGGVCKAISDVIEEVYPEKFKFLKTAQVHGIKDCKKILQDALEGKLDANFLEGMGCVGGCVGGPKALIPANQGKVFVDNCAFDSAIKMPLHSDTTEKILESLGINSIDDFNNPQKGEILHREFK